MNLKPIIFSILAIVILGGLFFVFKPNKPEQNTGPKTFQIIIQGKKIVSGPETMKVIQNDQVVIKITSDVPEEFHLHGYDRSVDLEQDKETQLTFTADLTGRFLIELEKSKTEIGALEVQPK